MQYDVIMCVTCEDIYPVVASLCHDHTAASRCREWYPEQTITRKLLTAYL